jgi:lipopolysaccharide export system protein LptC
VKKGSVRSQHPVEVKLLNGTLNANRLAVDDRGESIRFEGGVSMLLNLQDSATPQQSSNPQQAKR